MTFDKEPPEHPNPPATDKVDDRPPQHGRVIVRAKDMRKLTGIPDSTRADKENPKSPRFDSTFPKKIYLGPRSVGYFLDEVLAWLEGRKK